MLLTCDIGNTRIKTGTFENDSLVKTDIYSSVEELFEDIKWDEPDDIAFSSVVPEDSEKLVKFVRGLFHKDPVAINRESEFNLKISYDTPDTLGIDRICSAEGAFRLFRDIKHFKNYNEKDYILSIDFGTATTINLIKHPGEFSGGIIYPGFEMMFRSLNENTAQLPDAGDRDFVSYIGKDTLSSIAAGVLAAQAGPVERFVNKLKEEDNAKRVYVFITGGNAERIIPHLDLKFEYRKELVLIGIKTIFEKNS